MIPPRTPQAVRNAFSAIKSTNDAQLSKQERDEMLLATLRHLYCAAQRDEREYLSMKRRVRV